MAATGYQKSLFAISWLIIPINHRKDSQVMGSRESRNAMDTVSCFFHPADRSTTKITAHVLTTVCYTPQPVDLLMNDFASTA